jgi:hypothetical protein
MTEPARRRKGAAETAVLRDLAKLPDELRKSAVAVTAVWLARTLDEGGMPPRDAVGCVRELRMCMTQLREWNPAGETGDGTDAVNEAVQKVQKLYAVEGP